MGFIEHESQGRELALRLKHLMVYTYLVYRLLAEHQARMQDQGSVISDKPTKRSYTTSQDSRLAKNWYRRFRFACRVVFRAKVRLVPGAEHPKPCSILVLKLYARWK
jgi:hypothetical protein